MKLDVEKKYRAALRGISGIGTQRLRELIAYFGNARAAWEAPGSNFTKFGNSQWVKRLLQEREKIDPDAVANNLKDKDISLVIPTEQHYPFLLAELSDAPPILYYRGTLAKQAEALAVVGSRRATSYGRSAAKHLAKEAALQGIVIVSGLARGIDTAAHEGAMAGYGTTWAFLGCGLDYIYPPENQRLATEIIKNGAILTEYPPHTPPEAGNFPARNRLISGCTRGVVVVEAALKSGALITVDFALEQGREVFAVPGPIFNEMSKGTNHLIRSGAKIVESIEDIKVEIPIMFAKPNITVLDQPKLAIAKTQDLTQMKTDRSKLDSNSQHRELLELLSDVPIHIDQLILNTSLSPGNLALALLELQLEGKINQLPGQFYVLGRTS
ncbi:MAG: DNA-processing protein DprA [Desulfitobacterium hafniense]|nr:DNA-processing protein DprA [Desulfitobacterium hafniense]